MKADEKLKDFYKYEVSLIGIKESIAARKKFNTPRGLLVEELRSQYKDIPLTERQEQNLQLLLTDDAFTVCTAHQPNIFTGPLYFVYKILHAIKLSDYLNSQIAASNFVPVYYMGSEDADLDELGNIILNGEKLEWQTKQTGAVGRMKVDKSFLKLIDAIAGQITVDKYGKELIELFRKAYKEGENIQTATLTLVNDLFGQFGLLVLIPDRARLKKQFTAIVKRELAEQFSHSTVEETAQRLAKNYKVQASGREVNLFYLTETSRERIEKNGEMFRVEALGLSWNEEEIFAEVDSHPERFSPNVILRGVFQETVLPNIAFIGGGGEIAYWLELKGVFSAADVPYPVLIVRNSFLLVDPVSRKTSEKLGLSITDLFQPTETLVNRVVSRESNVQLGLMEEKKQLDAFYTRLRRLTDAIDITLSEHSSALKKKSLNQLDRLEKKMLRAEKRKFEAQQRQIEKLRQKLFPGNLLQERQENFSSFYAKYGKELLSKLYQASIALDQKFAILELK